MTASGGPNAATYMWYSDIATATAMISQRRCLLTGVVGCASSETTAGAASVGTSVPGGRGAAT